MLLYCIYLKKIKWEEGIYHIYLFEGLPCKTALPALCRQGFYGFFIPVSCMCLASSYGQISLFFCQFMIYLITICHTDSFIILQELFQMVCLSCFLVFIENDGFFFSHAGAVHPHKAFTPGISSVFSHKD